jgi:Methyltransferase domain
MSNLPIEIACPACHGNTQVLGHSVVAPFLTVLFHIPLGHQSDYRQCEDCGLSFFDARYRSQDLSFLYGQYRGDIYLRERHRWEPWYSNRVNGAYGENSRLVRERRSFMTAILRDAGIKDSLECAIDFGGDEGQFFPDIPIGKKVVCDPSERPPIPDIERISTLAALLDVRPDLVIVAHVLEHLSDPRVPLMDIRNIIADDGVVYVEVPLDEFRTHRSHSSDRYRRYLQRVASRRAPFIFLDFLTGVWRQYRRTIPRFGVIKQSEHINYFSERSLRNLITTSGFDVISEGYDPSARVGALRIGRYGIAARPHAN